VKYRFFRGTLASWDELFGTAAEFATELGELRLINISHSCDGGNGTIAVWYWADDDEPADV
jgi:hypothetical protein